MRSRCWRITLASLAVVTLFSTSARGERPFFFVSRAEPLDQGAARAEGGVTYERFSSTHERYTMDAALFFGVVNNLDFEVSLPYLFLSRGDRNDSGVGDITLRTRLRLIKAREANPLSISGQLVVKLPSASSNKGLGTGESDVGLFALASKRFEPLAVHLNLGYTFVGNPPGVNFRNEFSYALGFEFDTPLSGLQLYSEIGGHTNKDSTAESDPLAVTIGVSQPLGRRTVLDAGLAIGLASASPGYAAKIGASYRF